MVESYQEIRAELPPAPRYDKRRLSYATTFDDPLKSVAIRGVEWMTGKLPLIRMIRQFESMGVPEGQAFWSRALHILEVEITTPPAQVARIPREGPLVVVANHPHGLVDGIVLAELIGRVRQDYRILTRSLLTGVDEVARFLIPVPFPHAPDARAQNLEMRRRAMEHLSCGGAVVLFPSGVVAASRTAFGPAVEAEWNPFTAKLIHRSGAAVVPVHFQGQNSRWYQIANRLSPTLRQGLLLHEVVHAKGRPQAPVVGHPIAADASGCWRGESRAFMRWLRDWTLALARSPDQRVGTGSPSPR